ncbi:WXG100 family type VII secretion target, partial [Nocardia jiangxiensis]|uniref:WXG100 family type VII secretion target n=1 Tax=Nocardia jiangxiensis TaxID=282685 RepID=UPI001FE1E3C4
MTDHLSVLDQKVATLHSGGAWQGIAADAHQKAHAEWAVAAQEFVDGVADLSTAARNAHSQHSTAITANT